MSALTKLAERKDALIGALENKIVDLKDRAMERGRRLKQEGHLRTMNIVTAVAAPTLPVATSYAAGRLVAPEHQKLVAGIGVGGAVFTTGLAIFMPEHGAYFAAGSMALMGPAIGLAHDAGAKAREAAQQQQP